MSTSAHGATAAAAVKALTAEEKAAAYKAVAAELDAFFGKYHVDVCGRMSTIRCVRATARLGHAPGAGRGNGLLHRRIAAAAMPPGG
jgi:hypothetical protein